MRWQGGGGVGGAEERSKAMAYNNNYVDGRWGLFWYAGEMRLVTRKASLAGVELPASLILPTCNAFPRISHQRDVQHGVQ